MGYGGSRGQGADGGGGYGWLELEPLMGGGAPGVLGKGEALFQETPLESVAIRGDLGPASPQAFAC